MADDVPQTDLLRRLEKGFQDQQNAFQQTRDDVNSLKSGYNVIQRDVMSISTAIERLVSRFEESRKTNWPLLAMGAGLLPIVIGGMAFFMTTFTQGAIAPVQSQVVQTETNVKTMTDQLRDLSAIEVSRGKDISLLAQTTTANSEIINRMTDRQRTVDDSLSKGAAADENSRSDRQQLNNRVQKLETEIANEMGERRAQSAETRIQLGEIEQQFHSVSNLENLRAAQQERLNSMLWEKSHPGERYPNGTFFPTSIFQGQGGAPPMNNNIGP